MAFGCKGGWGVKPSMLEWAILKRNYQVTCCLLCVLLFVTTTHSKAFQMHKPIYQIWAVTDYHGDNFGSLQRIWAMMSGCLSQLKDTSVLSLLLMRWVMGEELAAFLENILFMFLGQNILIEYMREPINVFNQLKNETKN